MHDLVIRAIARLGFEAVLPEQTSSAAAQGKVILMVSVCVWGAVSAAPVLTSYLSQIFCYGSWFSCGKSSKCRIEDTSVKKAYINGLAIDRHRLLGLLVVENCWPWRFLKPYTNLMVLDHWLSLLSVIRLVVVLKSICWVRRDLRRYDWAISRRHFL